MRRDILLCLLCQCCIINVGVAQGTTDVGNFNRLVPRILQPSNGTVVETGTTFLVTVFPTLFAILTALVEPWRGWLRGFDP